MADSRAWELVMRRIEDDLTSGRLSIGDRLPAERALAAELEVGRSSVREAIRVLEVLGLVRTATGSGPSAGAIVVSRPEGAMGALIRLQVAGRGFDVAHIVSTRVVLEESVVTELAGGGVDLAASAALLDRMDGTPDRDAFLALDASFHLSLAELSGNSVIAAVMAGLRSSIEGYVLEGADRLDDWPAMAARLQEQHRAILADIDSGDTDAARLHIHDHITGYYAATNLIPTTKA